MSERTVCDVVGGVHEACVVAMAHIEVEIEYTKTQLLLKLPVLLDDNVLAFRDDALIHQYETGHRYFLRRLVVLEKILADLVKAEVRMATGQVHFKGILNYCRFGYCSE